MPSFARSPVAPVLFRRSDPARSTKWNLAVRVSNSLDGSVATIDSPSSTVWKKANCAFCNNQTYHHEQIWNNNGLLDSRIWFSSLQEKGGIFIINKQDIFYKNLLITIFFKKKYLVFYIFSLNSIYCHHHLDSFIMPLSKGVCGCSSSHHCTGSLTSLSAIIFFLLGPLWEDQTAENCLVPGRHYRQCVAIPPNAFPPIFLLHSGGVWMHVVMETDTFDRFTLSFWMKGWLCLVFKKLWIISCIDVSFFYQIIDEYIALRVPKNTGHNFPCRRCSLHMLSTSVWPSLNNLLQSYTCVFGSISPSNCALSLVRISAGFMFLLLRNLTRGTA